MSSDLIQRLRFEAASWYASDRLPTMLREAATLLEQQAAEIERLRVDAGRWQWWQDHGYTTDDERRSIENELLPSGEEFPSIAAAIDAAVSQAKEQG